MMEKKITIILNRPKYSENIGSAARAMHNMGMESLVLVAPQDFNPEKVKKTATHESIDIVNGIRIVDTVKEAVKEAGYVVGTTARTGKQRKKVITPDEMAATVLPLSINNTVAILFGPEDRGLENSDLLYCDALVNIPTLAFSSINLAHAVMIICYELSKGMRIVPDIIPPRLANKNELERLYDTLEKVLASTGYSNPENPYFFMSKFRFFLSDLKLKSREVVLVNGFLQKILASVPKQGDFY
jgi:tRNA/rRNA methyltransferase